jgi:nicotinate-nucleotide pyrophosphorylase (carboxylating)
MERESIRDFLRKALQEDVGSGDITTRACVADSRVSKADIIAREEFVLAGMPIVEELLSLVDTNLHFIERSDDGRVLRKDEVIATIEGKTASILTVERTALNILQRLSGIATLTRKFVEEVQGTGVKILDTRKTTPNMRVLEKYAVKVGGGFNHRMGLYDGILIKDNHIKAAGGIKEAVRRVRDYGTRMLKIEVEVETMEQVEEAIQAGVDIIMLDNMSLSAIREAVKLIRQSNPYIMIEVSGGVNLDNVRILAETGVDFISVGALTHSARAVDISLEIKTP